MFDDSSQVRGLGCICAGLLDIVLAQIHEALQPINSVLECFKVTNAEFASCCKTFGCCDSIIQRQKGIGRKIPIRHLHRDNSAVCGFDAVKIGGSIEEASDVIQLLNNLKVSVQTVLDVWYS